MSFQQSLTAFRLQRDESKTALGIAAKDEPRHAGTKMAVAVEEDDGLGLFSGLHQLKIPPYLKKREIKKRG